MTDIPKPLLDYLEKRGYFEQLPAGWFVLDTGSVEIAVDLRGDAPKVGVLLNGEIQESGHGIMRVDDVRNEVLRFWNKGAGNRSNEGKKDSGKKKEEEPAPQSKPELKPAPDHYPDDVVIAGAIHQCQQDKGTKTTDEVAAITLYWCGGDEVQARRVLSQVVAGLSISKPIEKKWKCGKCGTMNGEILDFCKDCGTARMPEKSLAEEAKPLMPLNENKWPASAPREAEVVEPEGVAPHVSARVHRPDAVLPVTTITPIGCMIKGFVPQLEEIGKIKIGEKGEKKTATGHSLPVKFDHFEVTTILRDEATGKFLPDPVMKELGENPRELDIMLLYNDISLNYRTRYNAYKGGKCICAGDGETATTFDGDTVVCNPDTCEKFQKKDCKLNGILSCILMKASRLGGVYKFRTTSHHTSRAILSSLMFISTLTGGTLAMIPLKMTISPKKVQPKNSQTAQTIYVVNVIYHGVVDDLLDKVVKIAEYRKERRIYIQQLEQTARLALAEPESEEEMKEVQAEFYPEPHAQEVAK